MKEEKSLAYLKMNYNNDYKRLKEDLLNKCSNLPCDVSLRYFCKALLNMMPEKRTNLEFTM